MAKTAAALHILVKTEKRALEILENWKRDPALIIWQDFIPAVRRHATAATWGNSNRA